MKNLLGAHEDMENTENQGQTMVSHLHMQLTVPSHSNELRAAKRLIAGLDLADPIESHAFWRINKMTSHHPMKKASELQHLKKIMYKILRS